MLAMLDNLKQLSTSPLVASLNSVQFRKAIAVFFGILSVLVVGLIVWVALSAPPLVSASSLNVSKSTAPNLRWNWFPSVQKSIAAPVKETSSEELARATIKAELLGVVLTEGRSYAAISTSKDPKGVYSEGDSIENNVTLEEIQDYRVIISQRGSRRQIPLKSLEKGGKPGAKRASLIEVNGSSSVNDSSSVNNSSQGFNLSGLVSTNPIQLPGGGIGLKLGGLSEDLTDLADVREGDVVLAVNGSPVSDLLTNPLLWQQFSRQTNMPITIKRGEEELELFVNAASLSAKILPRIGAGQVK